MESERSAFGVENNKDHYKLFSEIVKNKNNPYLSEYLESSKVAYEKVGIPFVNIEISEDLLFARLNFEVTKDMQAHDGIMHGGLISYIVDSVAGALALSRVENEHISLTTDFHINYKRPCVVGSKYTTEVKVIDSGYPREKYNFTIKDIKDDTVSVLGVIDYYNKKQDKQY